MDGRFNCLPEDSHATSALCPHCRYLRHRRDLGARPRRRHAEPEKADAERLCNFANLGKMCIHLTACLMNGGKWCPGKLKLATGLERNRTLSGWFYQTDDVAFIDDGLPAKLGLHAFEDGFDAARTLIGHRTVVGCIEWKFFMLGADAPSVFGLASASQITCQLFHARQCRFVRRIARHAVCP